MNDSYVQMLINERRKQKVSMRQLCEGVYSVDMFHLVEKGQRSLDRVTAKRLLARLGVDNGNYEHYLEYSNYEMWLQRMRLINYIEDGKLEEAERLLDNYIVCDSNAKNKSREKIENQFYIFMQLQILKHKKSKTSEDYMETMFEEALKLTVPNVDVQPLKKLRLSPLEITLVLEYKSRKNAKKSVQEKLSVYEELLEYVENVLSGTISAAKVYAKIVVYMYRDIFSVLEDGNIEDYCRVCEVLLKYCENALAKVKERKFLYYLTEILEMRIVLLSCFVRYKINIKNAMVIDELLDETISQLNTLKSIYIENDISPYMEDDCYIYRESGIYCVNEIVKIRRTMLDITQEGLCDDDISPTTIWRLENEQKSAFSDTIHKIFMKLKLFPSCVNTGIVTDKKEAVEMYEKIRYAMTSSKYTQVKELILKIKEILPNHPINNQVLLRLESTCRFRLGEISKEECIKRLKQALECTVNLTEIQNANEIYLTMEEITVLYLMSAFNKDMGNIEEAQAYIKELHKYCQDIEKQGLVDGRMGMYELVMQCVASLYGDMGRYGESNSISERLIKFGLKLKRGNVIHICMYNIAWNNDQASIKDYNYNDQIRRCIDISRLLGDIKHERFYQNSLKE